MEMFKCPLCTAEYDGWRSLHGHMLKSHTAEYKAKGCKLSAYGIDVRTKQPPGKKSLNEKKTPDDFRPLDLSDPDEAGAYQEGYRYYHDGNAYTVSECKEMRWI